MNEKKVSIIEVVEIIYEVIKLVLKKVEEHNKQKKEIKLIGE